MWWNAEQVERPRPRESFMFSRNTFPVDPSATCHPSSTINTVCMCCADREARTLASQVLITVMITRNAGPLLGSVETSKCTNGCSSASRTSGEVAPVDEALEVAFAQLAQRQTWCQAPALGVLGPQLPERRSATGG